ncbi:hypothetical protein BDQ17DRAFT_158444 [Cyathus striatus]|nr:hypothetical protein BDQ17DRAFT_158444 [Cyathus striatus]
MYYLAPAPPSFPNLHSWDSAYFTAPSASVILNIFSRLSTTILLALLLYICLALYSESNYLTLLPYLSKEHNDMHNQVYYQYQVL